MKRETYWDLLQMAGFDAPVYWSGHKCKKVLNIVLSADHEGLKEFLPDMKVRNWNTLGYDQTKA